MNKLVKINSNIFEDVEVDFFQNENGDIIMTAEQIGSALGYSDGRKAINNLYNRNRARLEKFSDVLKTRATDGKMYDTLIFNEHGIYALIFLSNKPKAIQFQEWVYQKISEIRKNNFAMVTTSEPQPELLQKVKELESKVESFITLTSYESRVIQKAIAKRIYAISLEPEYRPQAFAELHREIRDRFAVPSYRDIPRVDFQNALKYVNGWIPKKVTA